MVNVGGILLAGGSGTRLFPNTKFLNKHLLPIYDKPMIYYSLSILMLSEIRNITIVCNPKDENSYKSLLGDGGEFGLDLYYSIQEKPEGIPHAINTALEKNNYDKFTVTLGDNFLYGQDFFNNLKQTFLNSKNPVIYYQRVGKPENFGIIKRQNKLILDIIEKPLNFISNEAVIGLYIFDSEFSEHFQKLKKSKRLEFEIVDLIKQYGLENVESNFVGRGTAWFDMGSNDDFYNCTQFVKTIQDRQGLLVCSPHEIAYRNGWVTESEIFSNMKLFKNSEYYSNLKKSIS